MTKNKKPTVSVIIPSYNHENFIEECILSVLNQTYQDFEIIITDDGSSDYTVEIIERFSDPRIKLFKHPRNKGACVAANNCLQHASGKYIAMLSSDDAWYPEKLAEQVNFLEKHREIAAVFGKADWMDESSSLITNKFMPNFYIFEVENKTRFEWLKYFFLTGNCLCHPCSLVRKECYTEVGMFNPAFASLPDLDLWIRICLKYDIHILDKKLIRFRKINNEGNASGYTNTTLIRNRFEHRQSLYHYLQITNPDELLLIFPEAAQYGKLKTEIIPYFLGRIAIESKEDYKMLWGLDVIYALLEDEMTAQTLEHYCNFTYLDFIKLAGECDTFKITGLSSAPMPMKKSAFRLFLSASKRYIKQLYFIVLQLFGNKE